MWVITNLCIHNPYLINLTVSLTFWYTMYIMKKQRGHIMNKIKKLGLLDADFLQGMSLFVLALLVGGTS